jgi:hypothetical protein
VSGGKNDRCLRDHLSHHYEDAVSDDTLKKGTEMVSETSGSLTN